MMSSAYHFVFVALAVTGVILNWTHGIPVEAFQNAIFLYLAFEGLKKWKGMKW
jgi:hypothetical protein